MDLTLQGSYSINEVTRCIHIGLLCVQEDPAKRPTMATIELLLNSFSISLALPLQPAFFVHSGTEPGMPRIQQESDRPTGNSTPLSVNEMSITELYPR